MLFLATLISPAILMFSSPLLAQNFQIVPSTAPRGASGTLLILFASPAGREPIALQWKIALGTEVTAAKGDLIAGDAALEAGKMLTCSPTPGSAQGTAVYNCILAGGRKAIANGTIFLVKYKVKPEAKPSSEVVRVSDGIAVLQELTPVQRTPLAPVEGTITIR
jgi:hypothetical protein